MVLDADIPSVTGVLRYVPLFAGLTTEQLHSVASLAEARRLKAKQSFLRQGSSADVIYVVLGGQIRVSEITSDGHEIIYRFIGPGQMIGGMAAVGGMTYPINARAVRESSLLAWRTDAIQRLMRQHPEIALNAMRLMVQRIEELQRRCLELATEQVRQRVAHTILRLIGQHGRRVARGVLLDLRLSRQDLAKMAGTTLYTASRLLNIWKRRKIIAFDTGRILILRPHELVRLADGPTPEEVPPASNDLAAPV